MNRKTWDLLAGMPDDKLVQLTARSVKEGRAFKAMGLERLSLNSTRIVAHIHTYAHHERRWLLLRLAQAAK